MALDQTGQALGILLANALTIPPASDSTGLIPQSMLDSSNANISNANTQLIAQWTEISKIILDYLVANTVVNIPSLSVPASGIKDSTVHDCTGTANSTASSGTIS